MELTGKTTNFLRNFLVLSSVKITLKSKYAYKIKEQKQTKTKTKNRISERILPR